MEPKDIVRTGYDTLSYFYRQDDDCPVHHTRWAHLLVELLRPTNGARVLELGCGCGVPVAQTLARAGHHLVGVDISAVQVQRAKGLVPEGQFFKADITELVGASVEGGIQDAILNSVPFDAVVALYVLIHMPVEEQVALFRHLGNWIKAGGYCMMTVGVTAWTGEVKGWLGSDRDIQMWWSQSSLENYRKWTKDGGSKSSGTNMCLMMMMNRKDTSFCKRYPNGVLWEILVSESIVSTCTLQTTHPYLETLSQVPWRLSRED